MYIKSVLEINNYRNLTGLTADFQENINFIFGENNIGKTNLIELIYSIFSKGKFSKIDFLDESKPIRIKFSIGYSDEEIGFFGDYFDVDGENTITVDAIQESVDERIDYFNCENSQEISFSMIKKINTYYYHSQRVPSKEISFAKEQGAGRILNYFVSKSLEKRAYDPASFLNFDKLNVTTNFNHPTTL